MGKYIKGQNSLYSLYQYSIMSKLEFLSTLIGLFFIQACIGKSTKNPKLKIGTKIADVEIAPPSTYKWQALIFIDDLYTCEGSLIGNDLVVTAAHCVDGASETRVILGSYNLAEEEENGRIEVSSQEIIIHPSWDLYTSTENDIALIKLSKQVEFNEYIDKIDINDKPLNLENIGQFATLSSWSLVSDSISNQILKIAHP